MDVFGRLRRLPLRPTVVMVHVPIPSGMGKQSAGHVREFEVLSAWGEAGRWQWRESRMEGSWWAVAATALITMLVTWQWLRATSRWQRGRGLLGVTARVERENRERLFKARADRAQGWRELWRSLLEFLLVLVIVGLVGLVVGGMVGFGR